MASVKRVACMVMLCMAIAAPLVVNADISCRTVTNKLIPCVPYISTGAVHVSPTCCKGITDLKALARTTADRQSTCRCLQDAAKLFKPLNVGRVSGILDACGVHLPYPISVTINCDTVK